MKGILFKPDMIQAIVDGRKTQTRRVIKNQPILMDKYYEKAFRKDFGLRKPRYQVGEVVYIKEAWATEKMFDDLTPSEIEGTPVGTVPIWYRHGDTQFDRFGQTRGRWRSPRHMPEWAARYFIKILAVRAERLQEITEEDAISEGIDSDFQEYPRLAFLELWNSINKDYQWESNPWVFVYEFNFSKGYFEK